MGKGDTIEAPKPIKDVQPDVEPDVAETAAVREAVPAVGERPPLATPQVTGQDEIAQAGFPRGITGDKEIVFQASGPDMPGQSGIEADPVAARLRSLEDGFSKTVRDLPADKIQPIFRDIVGMADKLNAASPQELATLYPQLMEKMAKDHPELSGQWASRMLRMALRETPGNTISSVDVPPVSVIGDKRAVSAENPYGVVGRAFIGDDPANQPTERAVFDAANRITKSERDAMAALPPEQRQAFLDLKEQLDGEFLKSGLMAPPKEIPVRTPPTPALSDEQQKSMLAGAFRGSLAGQPAELAQDMVTQAKAIAFADPKEQGALLAKSYAEMAAKYPTLEPSALSRMFATAMNNATGTRDFRNNARSDSPLTMFTDKSRITEENPDGTFAAVVSSKDNPGLSQAALLATQDTATAIREGSASAKDGRSTKQFYDYTKDLILQAY